MILVLASLAWADCPEAAAAVEAASQALSTLDVDGTQAQLSEAERAFACGERATPDLLGRFWLIEGQLLALRNDDLSALQSLSAARRSAPGLAPENAGDRVDALFAKAGKQATSSATLTLGQPLSKHWRAYIDGNPVPSWPAEVSSGLHLAQIGEKNGTMHFARVLLVESGATTRIEHQLPEKPERPEQETIETGSFLRVALGPDASIGKGFSVQVKGTEHSEPAAKLLLPLRVAGQITAGRAWTELGAYFAPLVNGRFVYGGANVDTPNSTPMAFGADVSGGLYAGQIPVGVLLGAQLPSRFRVRGVGRIPLTDNGLSLGVEAGVNLPTSAPAVQRQAEPAIGLNASWRAAI